VDLNPDPARTGITENVSTPTTGAGLLPDREASSDQKDCFLLVAAVAIALLRLSLVALQHAQPMRASWLAKAARLAPGLPCSRARNRQPSNTLAPGALRLRDEQVITR